MTRNDAIALAIVDDDDDVRTALSRLLQAMGHPVEVFASAEEFEAATVAVDCVIVDVRLPGLSGIELGQRLRGRTTPVPVVLVTGDGDRLSRDFSRPMDTPLLTKPFDDEMLTAAIADAIATCPAGR